MDLRRDDLIDVWDDAVEGKDMVGGGEGRTGHPPHPGLSAMIPDRELNPDGNVMEGADYERARKRPVAMHSVRRIDRHDPPRPRRPREGKPGRRYRVQVEG